MSKGRRKRRKVERKRGFSPSSKMHSDYQFLIIRLEECYIELSDLALVFHRRSTQRDDERTYIYTYISMHAIVPCRSIHLSRVRTIVLWIKRDKSASHGK